MKQWKVPALIFGALTALAALQACATEDNPSGAVARLEGEAESEVVQQMDGCGAWLYRDTSAVSCFQVGTHQYLPGGPTGTCIDEEHISCKYPILCKWDVAEVTTACVEGSNACAQLLFNPPPNQPAQKVFTLEQSSQVCVASSTQSDRNSYCDTAARSNPAYTEARQFCAAQNSSVSGTISCCLSCISTPPVPGALAGTTPTPICTGVEDAAPL